MTKTPAPKPAPKPVPLPQSGGAYDAVNGTLKPVVEGGSNAPSNAPETEA